MEQTNWHLVKSEFIAGATLKSLAEKYSISFSTLKSRHAREKWSELRKKTEGKLQEHITTEIANQQTKPIINVIEIIDKTVKDLVDSLPNAECYSKESIAKAISDLLKTRGLYTGETQQKNNQGGWNADEIIKATIDYLDQKGVEEHDLDIKPYLSKETEQLSN